MSDEIPVLPMREALAHWKKLVPVTADDLSAIRDHYRVQAFTVSRLSALDQVLDVKKSLARALEGGQSMRQWRAENSGLWKNLGWDKGNAFKLDTIFRTNIQGAYHAGRWRQAVKDQDERPYAMYDAIDDGATRPTHAAQDGKIYRLGHSFWIAWWPPNGFNCRCSVRMLTEKQARDLGVTDTRGAADPDAGFDTNVGAAGYRIDLEKYTPEMRTWFFREMSAMPVGIASRFLRSADQRNLSAVSRTKELAAYESWRKGEARAGDAYPVGNVPAEAYQSGAAPDLSLVFVPHRIAARGLDAILGSKKSVWYRTKQGWVVKAGSVYVRIRRGVSGKQNAIESVGRKKPNIKMEKVG